MENYKTITRVDFMTFFRDDEKLSELTVDDRVEIFSNILHGSSDFTKELLNSILVDYSVKTLVVLEVKDGKEK